MTKHTPGPWKVFFTYNVQAKAERSVANCNTLSSNGPDWEQIKDENQANAYLIAAAPELLEACEAALPFIDQPVIVAKIKAAIAKARGEVAQ